MKASGKPCRMTPWQVECSIKKLGHLIAKLFIIIRPGIKRSLRQLEERIDVSLVFQMKLFNLVDDGRLQDFDVVCHWATKCEPNVVTNLVLTLILPKVFIVDAEESFPDFDDVTTRKPMSNTLNSFRANYSCFLKLLFSYSTVC